MKTNQKAATDLVARIRAVPGMAKKVVGRYNGSQGNADCADSEDSEAYQWIQHDYAIEQVALLLNESGLLAENDTIETVDAAFCEIC